jgi:hypothetical protein
MALSPQSSLPKQCGSWKDLKAAYRFLSNPSVTPDGIQSTHRSVTRAACLKHSVVLAVQDGSCLSFCNRTKTKGLGKLKRGTGQGLMQHSTLAVTTGGELLGILDQIWYRRVDKVAGETRKESRQRWRETDVWSDAVSNVGRLSEEARLVHVMDREGDSLEIIDSCDRMDVGFLIRAQHDRWVEERDDKLWSFMARQKKHGTLAISIGKQHDSHGKIIRQARDTTVAIRFGEVKLRTAATTPNRHLSRTVNAVYLVEENPPNDCDPVDWILFTSEPITNRAEAEEVVSWYTHRWVIEEWHRVEKEGCRLQRSQLDDAEDIKRLAALIGVIAVRMMRLRDLAGFATSKNRTNESCHDAKALQDAVPRTWIAVVAHLAQVDSTRLTPKQFWITIAKKGGYIGRRRDGNPGWKTIWQGWYDIQGLVNGVELLAANPGILDKCG